MEEKDTLKSYAIKLGIIAIAIGFIVHSIKSCGPVIPGLGGNQVDPTTTPVVDQLGNTANGNSGPGISAPRKPKPKEANTPTPDGGHPASVTDVRPPACRPWKKLTQKIIVSDKGNTFVSQVCESYVGFNFQTKFFLGYNGYGNLGLMQNFFRYDRYDLGAIVAFPSVGVGLSGYLTDHLYLTGGATWNYMTYENPSDFKTYAIGDFKARPMLGFGFDF